MSIGLDLMGGLVDTQCLLTKLYWDWEWVWSGCRHVFDVYTGNLGSGYSVFADQGFYRAEYNFCLQLLYTGYLSVGVRV